MDRRTFLRKISHGAAVAGAAGLVNFMPKQARSAGTSHTRPNILIIIIDDQGYADLGAFEHHRPDISTPNLDRICGGGVLLSRAYVTAPVCSPSRSGWNTGKYQQRWDRRAGWSPGLPGNVKTLAEHLKAAGYATAKVGKNDFGKGYHNHKPREYPLNHGYDEFLGFSSHAHDYFLLSEEIEDATPDPHGTSAALGPLMHNKKWKSYRQGYTTEIFTDWAIEYLKRRSDKDRPFFLTVSYNSVHHLIHEVPPRYLKKYGVKKIPDYDPAEMGKYLEYYDKYNQLGAIKDEQMRKYFLANLNCLDDNVGRLLEAMDELKLSDNTLVIYFSDNGGSHLTGADNRPLRDGKYTLYEGGIRVPMALRWPGKLPAGGLYKHAASTLDIVPTCLAAGGIKIPEGLDGTNMLDALKNDKPAPTGQKPMFWKFGGQWAVRHNDWKLVWGKKPRRKATSQIIQGPYSTKGRPQLFNLADDPAEQNDLAGERPGTVARLKKLYEQWENTLR